MKRTVDGLTLTTGRDWAWETLDGKYAITQTTVLVLCEHAHPVRVSKEALRRGQDHYWCPGGETHDVPGGWAIYAHNGGSSVIEGDWYVTWKDAASALARFVNTGNR